ERLPAYMVPTAFVRLSALPLMATGKLDRKALPAPAQDRSQAGAAYVAPRTQMEQDLAEIWSELLGVQQIGIHDNFLDLGSDSLRSGRVAARENERGMGLTLRMIFEHPPTAKLAVGGGGIAITVEARRPVPGRVPLNPPQHWLLEQSGVPHHQFYEPYIF